MKPYIRYGDSLYPVKDLIAEVLCTAAFLFALGCIVGNCMNMVSDLTSTENTLDSLRRTAEEP